MTIPIVPRSTPQLSQVSVIRRLHDAGVDMFKPAILAVRGYYRDTMGEVGVNDINLYDDGLFYLSPTAFGRFNANTDPSKHKQDRAWLTPGTWRFRLGIHNQSKDPLAHPHYKALVQGQEFTVEREGTESVAAGVRDIRGECLGGGRWRGTFGINLHEGGYTKTSSEGCLTIHPDQWDGFIGMADGDMKRHGVMSLPLVLTLEETK